jgi:hypothetical protein
LQLHVVHYNSDKYKSFQEASDKPDGLAVLAFFFEVRSGDLRSGSPSSFTYYYYYLGPALNGVQLIKPS